jgi:hypothetical protein
MTISAADARLFVEELETGRGRLAQLAERYPALREESQRVLATMCGSPVLPLFRHIQLRNDEPTKIRPEQVTSLTASPQYALGLAIDAPGMVMTSEAFISMVPALMRYDVPVERVLLYVPVVADDLTRERTAALGRMKIRTRRGGSMTGTEIVREVLRRKEHEVVADVSGLSPSVVEFSRTEDIYQALYWLRGEARTGADAVRLAEGGGRIFVQMRDGKFVQSSEIEEARWDTLFERLEEFFATPCDVR